ncbi:FKBP-type peptidyl-prolyl cis-trans isomerase FkpA [Novosphingobium sp. PhB165]|uniref:FKBP-type peptidyl-prolyl cis-trans isomerase n=1 Tax=Novosphingobium sp. PhB165 TaxID=2485105 RepID=UPI0010E716DD|nr:FKBP-type peptidyl-prolyl cis-trans isomerase [Novosphingobium sp. PhB165]TCM19452.1 FKBP-type peptidyl-prolyl cis-trans isomerase FkpA [Novosphingobium sp. PhB165]
MIAAAVKIAPIALAFALMAPVAAHAAAPAAAAPAAATAAAPTVKVETLTAGEGAKPSAEDYVLVAYKGMLKDGTVFDQSDATPMAVADVVPGFAQGLVQMQRGGSYRLTIPAALGYGAEGSGPIPPNSDLVFEVQLIDWKTHAEFEQMMAAVQAQQQAGQQGAPAGQPAAQQPKQ